VTPGVFGTLIAQSPFSTSTPAVDALGVSTTADGVADADADVVVGFDFGGSFEQANEKRAKAMMTRRGIAIRMIGRPSCLAIGKGRRRLARLEQPTRLGVIMIGEKISETTGKTTGVRVLPATTHDHHHGARLEISMQQTGKILGVDVTDMGTYEACLQHGGFYDGHGQGVAITKDGEPITWKATGIGRPTGKGTAVNWRGSIHYTTTSQKLNKLNGTCYVFEYEVDENGVSAGRVFEWK